MGWKSVFKKIGKVALKVAPYAAMAIPGIGPVASMAIQAGIAAADRKVSGGNWKQALLAGAIGGGTAGIASKIPGGTSGVSKFAGGLVGKGATKSVTGMAGKALGDIGIGMGAGALDAKLASKPESPSGGPMSRYGRQNTSYNYGGGINSGYADQENPSSSGGRGSIFSRAGREARGMESGGGSRDFEMGDTGARQGPPTYMPQGGFRYEDNPVNQYNQNMPNLSMALHQGRQEALMNQPWRDQSGVEGGQSIFPLPTQPEEGSELRRRAAPRK